MRTRKLKPEQIIVPGEYYLENVLKAHPDLIIYAIRLDRGLSPKKILDSIPGKYWKKEK